VPPLPGGAKAKWCIVSRPQPSLFFTMITLDSAAIALAHAASKAGVQCDLEPIIESEIERDLFEAERPTEKGRRRKSAQRSRI